MRSRTETAGAASVTPRTSPAQCSSSPQTTGRRSSRWCASTTVTRKQSSEYPAREGGVVPPSGRTMPPSVFVRALLPRSQTSPWPLAPGTMHWPATPCGSRPVRGRLRDRAAWRHVAGYAQPHTRRDHRSTPRPRQECRLRRDPVHHEDGGRRSRTRWQLPTRQ